MRLTRFEALGLLPDGEVFTVYRNEMVRGEKVVQKFTVSLDQLLPLVADRGLILCKHATKRLGHIIVTQRAYALKPDRKKVERFLKANKKKAK